MAVGYGFFIDKLDIAASVIAALLVIALALFSQYTRTGRALRAVADDHQAALSVGISLQHDLGDRLVDRRLRGAGRGRSCGARSRACSSRCR